MRTLSELLEAIHKEALRAEFPIDRPVYEKAGKDPLVPILYAGSLEAPVCVLGRDLGKDEVAAGQPLIGAGGRLVRSGFFQAEHGVAPPVKDKSLESVLPRVLLTNTVPYKPPGNKAYATSVKERFRPLLAEFLVAHWTGGNTVITLGNEAFQWFTPSLESPEVFWSRDDRYEATISCVLTANTGDGVVRKALTLMPLPHPSPLNARWYPLFPGLLAKRLVSVAKAGK